MRLNTAEFLRTKINHALPGLDGIPALLDAGQLPEAEAAFRRYLQDTLQLERYFSTPYYPPENAWIKKGETEADAAERLARGEIVSVYFPHCFGSPEEVQFEANPTPNQYVEWTYQINRHHEWRMLGHLYRETGDEKYAKLFVKFFTGWRAQCECPPEDLSGYRTKSFRTIEIGIRLTKIWHYAIHAFLFSPSLSDHLYCDWFASLWENANSLRHRATSHNWLIMEMAGLFHTGLLYPFLLDAEAWREYAAARLEEELTVQVYPDSFQYELTTGYHGVVIENYRYVIDICRAMGAPLPPVIGEQLGRMYDMYPKLVKPNWMMPGLNDAGDFSPMRYFTTGLAYFPEKEELRYFASSRAEGEPMYDKDSVLPYAGIAVLRDDWTEDSQWLLFESGPFGFSHQHEDKLHVLLHAYGRTLLRDTGSFSYDKSKMRGFVVSTRAHNTVMADGMGQNRRGRYEWHAEDIGKLSDLQVRLGEEYDVLEGEYSEGYGPEYLDITHRRRVIKVKNHPLGLKTFYIVIDRMAPADGGEHRYEALWQLESVPVRLQTEKAFTRVDADYGDGVTLTLLSDGELTVRRGCTEPFMGWRTPDVPAPALLFGKNGAEAQIVTLLYPSDGGCPITGFTAEDGKITLTVGGESWTIGAGDTPGAF